MRITESKLRSIIRQVIKESKVDDDQMHEDLFRFLDGHGVLQFGLSAATESNLSWGWSEIGPTKQELLYKECEERFPYLLPTLRKIMGLSDRHKKRTQTSSDGRFTTTSYRGMS